MALQISPPSCFDFSKSESWEGWYTRFERYCSEAGLRDADDAATKKLDTLLYLLGEKADDVVRSFSLTSEEVGNYTVVKEKFTAYFNVRRNMIYERANFNSRVQRSGEPIDDFLTSLYSLAESCSFGQLKEELIRDRVVVGILAKSLSERLQLDPTLTG